MEFAKAVIAGAVFFTGSANAAASDVSDREYVVTTRTIYPGQEIGLSVLETRQHHVSIPTRYLIVRNVHDITGMIAAKTIVPGKVIQLNAIAAKPLVRGGQQLTVLIKDGFVRLSLDAVAMTDGGEGEKILVRNQETARTLCVVVVSSTVGRPC